MDKKFSEIDTIKPDVELDEKIYFDSQKGTWQQIWIKDVKGNPVVFLKINTADAKTINGEILYSGVRLCDIEINPAYKGKNAALAALRVVKKNYNVPHIWLGDVLSAQGFNMYKKYKRHEKATGESIFKLEPWVKEENIIPDEEGYSFVESWDKLIPKYRL